MRVTLLLCFFLSQAYATEYLIKHRAGGSQKSTEKISVKIKSQIKRLGGRVTSQVPELNMVVAEVDDAKTIQLDDVEYIEENRNTWHVVDDVETAVEPTLPKEAKNLWGMKAINAVEAWKYTHGDKSIIVAVSDTGIFSAHTDLKKNIWVNVAETGKDANGKDKSKNKIDEDGNGFVDDVNGWNFVWKNNSSSDMHYHGTHVAGTIGAVEDGHDIMGVMGQVTLMPVAFLDSSGYGTTENSIKSIIYAADNGAKILNASWGDNEYSQALKDAIDYAGTKGMIVVAAAGNDDRNTDKKPHYPSSFNCENLISVGATSDAKHKRAYFSNYGVNSVHLSAPGDGIYSTFNPMTNAYSSFEHYMYQNLSGTSMAAPHVSGVLGLIYSANPNLTWRQAKEILLSTVTPVEKLRNRNATGGVVNAGAAVRKALELRTN